ncbi:MAG: hypothetical protein DRO40_11965 [Thermoprotei archaeon]|nr:MAG: hypothetical protein DRO40_11965 [Thermoprotei archaeon]
MGLRLRTGLGIDDIVYIKKLLHEIEEALGVIEKVVRRKRLRINDKYALRYAIVEIVESLALISQRIARAMDYPLEGYVEAMKFYSKAHILDEDIVKGLVRLARLRNLIIHRYWEIDDNRIVAEARGSNLEIIRRALDGIRRFIEG